MSEANFTNILRNITAGTNIVDSSVKNSGAETDNVDSLV
jgi:hypothetical protein